MSKIDLTNKTFDKKVQLVLDYIVRRQSHNDQEQIIKMSQILKNFKDRNCKTDKDKMKVIGEVLYKIINKYSNIIRIKIDKNKFIREKNNNSILNPKINNVNTKNNYRGNL